MPLPFVVPCSNVPCQDGEMRKEAANLKQNRRGKKNIERNVTERWNAILSFLLFFIVAVRKRLKMNNKQQ